MKIAVLSFLLFIAFRQSVNAQLYPGFDSLEAKEMIMLSNSYTYLDLYGDDSAIIPAGYRKVYTSPTLGMDNKFQTYIKGTTAVINFRGSTDQKMSWLENVNASMLPIEGLIKTQEGEFKYCFGKDTNATVHGGYTVGISFIFREILEQFKSLNEQGINDIILNGHSQGGAIAILIRSYIFNSCKPIEDNNTIKVYTFAQPMSGNNFFVKEYNSHFCSTGMSYSFVNPDDLVPTMPISYNDSSYFRDNITTLIRKETSLNGSKVVKEGFLLLFNDGIDNIAQKFGNSIHRQLEKKFGEIETPPIKGHLNYAQVGNLTLLPPPEYPLEMKDSSLLYDSTFLAGHPRDDNGIFLSKSVYKKTSMSLNHKPYNYYTSILKKYFPQEYNAIEPKSFGL